MKRPTFFLTAILALIFSLAALGIGAAVDSPRTLMSRADFDTARKAIGAEMRLAFARCREHKGAERDFCKAQVRAEERVKVADLQARYYGTVAAAEDARIARVKAGFDLARARCEAREAAARLECLRAAREDRVRSLAAARDATT
jgi:hyperosmotically inducible periplasmic protein